MFDIVKVSAFLLRFSGRVRFARGAFTAIVLLGLVGGLANAALIAFLNARLTHYGAASRTLIWSFVGLCAALPVSRFLSEVLLLRMTQKSILEVRMRLCRQILAVPLQHLEKLGAHRLLAALTDDVATITAALLSVPLLSMNLTMVIGGLAYLGWLSWQVLLAVLGAAVIGVASYQFLMGKALLYFELSRGHWDLLFKHLRSLAEGIKELKLHRERRAAFVVHGLESSNLGLQRTALVGNTISAAALSWGQVLFFLVIGVLLFLPPQTYPISDRTLVGYTLTLLYMMTPLQVILGTLPGLARASVAVGKLEELGLSLTRNSSEAITGPAAKDRDWRQLELAGVTHTYRGEADAAASFMLGPLDLKIQPGELVFIVGGNGSGKTTLAKVIVGLYAPESGEVRLDGKPIDDESRDAYRQLFSAVFTDFFLFETLFGLENPDLDARAQWYLRALQLEKAVKVENGELSSIALSQGQRKRLALLTAYLEDRPIYLFDEWAADQDPYFKEVFYHQLLPELRSRKKTVIVVSHDDRYYGVASRIVKLDYGKVEYDGSPDGLRPPALPGADGILAMESSPVG